MAFSEEHTFPTIRIQKIVLENFKSVKHGEVLFNCGKKTIPLDTEPDILGIYGQNGSGKTAVIQALSVLQSAMSGKPIHGSYSDCISVGADYSTLSFTFDLQYPETEKTRTVVYTVKLGTIQNEERIDFNQLLQGDDIELDVPFSSFYEKKIKVIDEVLSASGWFDNSNQKMQVILTTSASNYPIGPVRKISRYVGNDRENAAFELEVNRRTASKNSTSFVFSKDTMQLFKSVSDYLENTEYIEVLMELQNYAMNQLFVVDTSDTALGGTQFTIPIFTQKGLMLVSLLGRTSVLPQRIYDRLERAIEGINTVLPSLVTGLQIELSHNEVFIGPKRFQETRIYSNRNGCLIPLRAESAGLIRIISILSLVISAYNENSITVAIDELDAGIYEYLLGEMLRGLELYGKGQFIFTSHNLRPLEVLKKENIIFTTANPENRYIRLKGVGHSNNLRRLYISEIQGNSQDEIIYDAAKSQKMNAAFMKAGEIYGEE